MNKRNLHIAVRLGPASFKNFAVFDAMTKQQKWRTPVMIGAVGIIGGLICFLLQDMSENMFLLGVFLMVLGMFVPSMYFRKFYASIQEQTVRMKIEEPRQVYTIELGADPNGIVYYHPKEKTPAGAYAWKEIDSVWRTEKAIYLYVDPTHALLIPDTTKNVRQDEVWELVKQQAKPEKLHDEREKNSKGFLHNILVRNR